MNGDLLSDEWWHLFCGVWNASPHRHRLATLGLVGFDVCGGVVKRVYLYWDDSGDVREVDPLSTHDIPLLSASVISWQTFLRDPDSLMDSIVNQRIVISGHGTRLLPFIQEFRFLAEAMQASSPLP